MKVCVCVYTLYNDAIRESICSVLPVQSIDAERNFHAIYLGKSILQVREKNCVYVYVVLVYAAGEHYIEVWYE